MRSLQFFLVILAVCIQSSVYAGGWPQKKGEGYFKLYEWWVVADEHRAISGKIVPSFATFGTFNTNIYGEYGFTDRLTGILSFTPFSRSFRSAYVNNGVDIPAEYLNSLGDSDIGVKYGLTPSSSPIAVSSTLLLGLPLGVSNGGTEGQVQTGDGEFNQYLQIDAGSAVQVSNINLYANLHVGINNRTNGFSEELRYGLEIGAGFFKQRLWVSASINVNQSLDNGSENAPINGNSLFSNEREYTTFYYKAAFKVYKNLGITGSFSGGFREAVISRNIYANPSCSVGIFWELKN